MKFITAAALMIITIFAFLASKLKVDRDNKFGSQTLNEFFLFFQKHSSSHLSRC